MTPYVTKLLIYMCIRYFMVDDTKASEADRSSDSFPWHLASIFLRLKKIQGAALAPMQGAFA